MWSPVMSEEFFSYQPFNDFARSEVWGKGPAWISDDGRVKVAISKWRRPKGAYLHLDFIVDGNDVVFSGTETGEFRFGNSVNQALISRESAINILLTRSNGNHRILDFLIWNSI